MAKRGRILQSNLHRNVDLPDSESERPTAGPLLTALLAGMAGAMAWGIRGQYGHETGAMMAGVLVGFIVVVLHGQMLTSLMSARAVAMFAIGISVGGSMTYGQTVGLTHDAHFVGNQDAYFWGMLGLSIKGAVWIAMGAAMFGMALSGKRYRTTELCILLALMLAAYFVGVLLLNRPFSREPELVPRIYFSHYSFWAPKVDRPRPECWGGLVAAFIVLMTFLSVVKRDWLGFSLGLWGVVGGAVGFPLGQAIQAYNAWHGEWVTSLPTNSITKYFNWWNMMETTFGFVMGAIVGLGCWFHRRAIGYYADPEDEQNKVTITPFFEVVLLAFHIRLLVAWSFQSLPWVDAVTDHALTIIIVPTISVMAGRFWPYLVPLPIVTLPIAGKTVRQLIFGENATPASSWPSAIRELIFADASPAEVGWDVYLVFPLVIATLVAIYFSGRSHRDREHSWFPCIGLCIATWLFFSLNFAFFHVPWPWLEWTGRTPNGLIFLCCAICLTLAAIRFRPRSTTFDEGADFA